MPGGATARSPGCPGRWRRGMGQLDKEYAPIVGPLTTFGYDLDISDLHLSAEKGVSSSLNKPSLIHRSRVLFYPRCAFRDRESLVFETHVAGAT